MLRIHRPQATGQVTPVAARISAGPGMAVWAPGRVTAAAPAAAAALVASGAGTPAARATASAPTNVSPAPTVSTAWTGNPLMTCVVSGLARAAPWAPAVTTAFLGPRATRSLAASWA